MKRKWSFRIMSPVSVDFGPHRLPTDSSQKVAPAPATDRVSPLAAHPVTPTPEPDEPMPDVPCKSDAPPDRRPTSPLIERRGRLSSAVETELRNACAALVKDYMPASLADEYMDIPWQLVHFEDDHYKAGVPASQGSNQGIRSAGSRGSFTAGLAEAAVSPSAAAYAPKNAAASFTRSTSRSSSLTRVRSVLTERVPHGPHTKPPVALAPNCREIPLVAVLDQIPPVANHRDSADRGLARQSSMGKPPRTADGRIVPQPRSRASNESMRSAPSDTKAGDAWWGERSLRRRTSNGSYKNQPIYIEPLVQRVDLNRPLPPLPSLSSYVQKSKFKEEIEVEEKARVAFKEPPLERRQSDRPRLAQKIEVPRRTSSAMTVPTRGRRPLAAVDANSTIKGEETGKGDVGQQAAAQILEAAQLESPTRDKAAKAGLLKRRLSRMTMPGFRINRQPKPAATLPVVRAS